MLTSTLDYVTRSTRRTKILAAFTQPLTPRQLARRTRLDRDCCSLLLGQLALRLLVSCLNPAARRSRLYWPTPLGISCQRRLPGAPERHLFPEIDWVLYGWVNHSQRSAVLLGLHREAMTPLEIRRSARLRDGTVTMNTNNVRDILRLYLDAGIVKKVWLRKIVHPRYSLTELGVLLRELLLRGEGPA